MPETLTLNDILGNGLQAGIDKLNASLQEADATMKSLAKESASVAANVQKNSGARGTSGSDIAARKKAVEELAGASTKLITVQDEMDRLGKQRNLLITRQNELLNENKRMLQAEKQALSEQNKLLNAGAGSLREMEVRLSKLRNEYANMSNEQRNAKETGGALLLNIKSLAKETDKLRMDMGQAQQRVGGYATAIKEVGGAMLSQVGLYGGIAGGVALIGKAFGSGITTIKEYSLEWSKLKALVGYGVSKQDLTVLQQSANIGADLGKSATDVTKLQIELARFGLTAKQIIDVTPGVLKLAAATGEDLAGIAATVSANLKTFNLDASESYRIVGVMNRTFNESASGLSDFAESSKYAATGAKAAGVSFEMMSSMLATLADRGIKGSMAGTALRRIFDEMTRTGKPVAESWAEITKKGLNVKDAFDEVGRTAQNALMILSENKTKVDELTQSFGDAAKNSKVLGETIGTMTDNLTTDIDKLSVAWDNLWLSIDKGDGIISKISRKTVQIGKDILDFISMTQMSSDQRAQLLGKPFEAGVEANVKTNLNSDYVGFIKSLPLEIIKLTEKQKELNEVQGRTVILRQLEKEGTVEYEQDTKDIEKNKKALGELAATLTIYKKLISDPDYRKSFIENNKLTSVQTENNNEQTKSEKELLKEKKEQLKSDEALYQLRLKYGLVPAWEQIEHETKAVKKYYEAGILGAKEYYQITSKIGENILGKPVLKGQEKVGQLDQKNLGRTKVATGVEGMKTDRFNLVNALAGDTKEVWDFFGITGEKEQKVLDDALGKVTDSAFSMFNAIYDKQVDFYDKEAELREQRISDLKDAYEKEKDIQDENKANGDSYSTAELTRIQAQINEEERLRKEALVKKNEYMKKQMNLEAIQQASNLITASATIFKDYSAAFPIAGPFLAAGVIATMIASFIATQAQARALTKAEKGYTGVMGGALHSESSNNRPMLLDGRGNNVEIERDEAVGILSRNATAKYSNQFFDFVNNANAGKLDLYGGRSLNVFAKSDNSDMVREQKRTNELLGRSLVQTGKNEFTALSGNFVIRKTL